MTRAAAPGRARPSVPHVLHVFATFAPAGPQLRTARLLAGFGSEFRHTIVALDGDTGAAARLAPELDVAIAEPPPRAGTLATSARLRGLLTDTAPDLLLTYNFGAIDALFAARSAGFRRVVHHEDGFRPDEADGLKRRRNWARRAAFGGIARLVVISANLERIAREVWKQPAERVAFIPNGIDVERFAAADRNLALRRELGIPEGALVVGSVGHLRAEKRFERLLLAAAEIDLGLHVVLLGDGPERERLELVAAEVAGRARVHFAGYRAEPAAWYRLMDVFALSSDTEQAPIALLEAMASGLPVAATDVGDVRAMLGPTAAGVVARGARESDNVRGLALQLAALCADPGRRAREGRENRARAAAEFSAGRMLGRYGELYRSVLAR